MDLKTSANIIKNICAKCQVNIVSGNSFKFKSSAEYHVESLDKDRSTLSLHKITHQF